jgi:hypothetical protein
MSGIPTSVGTGDVTLAGGTLLSPQTFTGFNEFDELTQFKTKRPELSDAGGATFPPTDDEFITKLDGVDLFGSLSGSAQLNGGGNTAEDPPQTFTGFNEFDEKVVIKGENIDFTNATRRVIDMTIAPLASNSNKLIMEASTTEITMTSGGSKNQLSQVASSSAINSFLQTGTASTINLISQVGANSTITTDGKFTTATAPSGVNDLCNKAYVDSGASGSASFRSFAVADRRNPASTRSVTGVTKFDPNVLVYQYPTTITMWDFANNWHSITIKGFYSFYWGAAQFSGNTSTRLTIYRNGVPQNTTGNNTYMCGNQVSAVFECDIADYIQVGCEVSNMCYYAFCDTTDPNSRYNTFNGYLLQAT